MDILLLFLVLFVILTVFIIISIIKKLLKIALILGIIFVVLFIVTGGSIVNDFSKLKMISDSSNIVLLENKGNIITGFIEKGETSLLKEDRIALIDSQYKENKLEEIKGDNNRLFIINAATLNELENIKVNNKEVTAEEFAYLYKNKLKINKKPIFFFRNYKEGEIVVYPETMFFRFTKVIPLHWIDTKLNKLKTTLKEKTKEAVANAAKEAVD